MRLRSMFVTLRAAAVMVALVALYSFPSAILASQSLATESGGTTVTSGGMAGGVRSDATVLSLEADDDDADELDGVEDLDDELEDDDADDVDDDVDDVDDDDDDVDDDVDDVDDDDDDDTDEDDDDDTDEDDDD